MEQDPDLTNYEADVRDEEVKEPIVDEPLTPIRPLVGVKSGRDTSDDKRKKKREMAVNQQQAMFKLKWSAAQ